MAEAEALPAGEMHPPTKALQLEWFYMSFHKEDRAKYVKSGRHLTNKMLESVAEHFENIFNLQVADGSLAKKRDHQIEQHVRCEMHHELRKPFDEKVHRVIEQHHQGDDHHSRQGCKYYCHDYKWQDHDDSSRCNNTATRCSRHAWCTGRRASTPPRSATKTPRTTNIKFKTKKHQYKAHHNNAHYTSDYEELRISTNTPVPSEDPVSASSESKKTHEDENYHLYIDKKMKACSHVPCKSDHPQHRAKAQSSQKGKKGESPSTFLDNDLNFTDTILMGLDSIDADLNRPDDVTNPFNFDM